MPFLHTTLHCSLGSLDLCPLPSSLLAKLRQKNRPSAARQVVRDALPVPTHVEAQLPQLGPELLGVRLVEERASVGEQVDVERGMTKVRIAER